MLFRSTQGTTIGYKVDLLESTGFGAAVPDFRFRKNLKALNRDVDAARLKNRLYPTGAETDGVRLTVQDTLWEVGVVPSANEVDMPADDELIGADDHLNGKWIERLSEIGRASCRERV